MDEQKLAKQLHHLHEERPITWRHLAQMCSNNGYTPPHEILTDLQLRQLVVDRRVPVAVQRGVARQQQHYTGSSFVLDSGPLQTQTVPSSRRITRRS